MNIFITSKSPTKCARYLDNKRVVKMVLETAQILSTALRISGYDLSDVYKVTHANHPSNVWARTSRSNYKWLLAHFRALCDEYTYRFGKVHKSSRLFNIFLSNVNYIPAGVLTPFCNCAANKSKGISYKHLPVIDAYRMYLRDRFFSDKLPAFSYIQLGE